MKIVDPAPEHEEIYCLCLENWSDDIREAGNHKREWYARTKGKGLRVKLALDDQGRAGGMIQYLPIEQSPAAGSDLYFILCVWVHGYKQGRGNFQKKGMGTELLAAAEADARELGAKGMAAWGVLLPFWMKASWFKKHGYKKADKLGMMALMWKPFGSDAKPPAWIKPKKKPQPEAGKVVVTGFLNGWCPAMNLVFERGRRAAAELGPKVEFRTIRTCERDTFLEWGMADALFVDDKEVRSGPPPKFEKIKRKIEKQLKKL